MYALGNFNASLSAGAQDENAMQSQRQATGLVASFALVKKLALEPQFRAFEGGDGLPAFGEPVAQVCPVGIEFSLPAVQLLDFSGERCLTMARQPVLDECRLSILHRGAQLADAANQ